MESISELHMSIFEIASPLEAVFPLYENQILLLIPARCRNLTECEYENFRQSLSSRGYDFIYLPRLLQSISAELLDYFIPGQTDRTETSCDEVQNRILGELGLSLSEPAALMNEYGSLIGFRAEEEGEDIEKFLRALERFIGQSSLYRRELDNKICASPCFPTMLKTAESYDEEYSSDLLIGELQKVQESKLRELGLSESALRFILGRVTPKLSRLRITRCSKIVLDDYAGREIKLDDKTKALYFLYLRHPEGIAIKALRDHSDELMDLYQSISGRDDPESMMKTITNLTDPFQNNANISLSRIKKAFCDAFTSTLASQYYVGGERGESRKVAIDRSLVIWETIR